MIIRESRHTDRIIDIEGVRNARDLGGLSGGCGRPVREGMIFRSGRLAGITEAGIAELRSRNITAVVDMRSDDEAAKHPDPEIEGVVFHRISVLDPSENMRASFGRPAGAVSEEEALVRLLESGFSMSGIYTGFVEQEFAMKGMAEAIRIILNHPEGEAVLIHCNGGKDRTGTLTLFIYTLLGVDMEDILEDFEMSNDAYTDQIEYLQQFAASMTDDRRVIDEMKDIAGVTRKNMEMALELMTEHYGSVTGYIRNGLGITDEEAGRMREKYLAADR